ncbi:hypothetical protein [Vibrio phage VP882]|uniref:Uncharacterized protein n=1 Tax=Vibrio phage VP882 TaxID=2913982 RepID=A2I2X4_9CAUD|nr:hypothetical protein VPVV882_gp15 [Vibrio phage VP882]ABM73388.1 hypothetical protein [Vibrio phage VP882]
MVTGHHTLATVQINFAPVDLHNTAGLDRCAGTNINRGRLGHLNISIALNCDGQLMALGVVGDASPVRIDAEDFLRVSARCGELVAEQTKQRERLRRVVTGCIVQQHALLANRRTAVLFHLTGIQSEPLHPRRLVIAVLHLYQSFIRIHCTAGTNPDLVAQAALQVVDLLGQFGNGVAVLLQFGPYQLTNHITHQAPSRTGSRRPHQPVASSPSRPLEPQDHHQAGRHPNRCAGESSRPRRHTHQSRP